MLINRLNGSKPKLLASPENISPKNKGYPKPFTSVWPQEIPSGAIVQTLAVLGIKMVNKIKTIKTIIFKIVGLKNSFNLFFILKLYHFPCF